VTALDQQDRPATGAERAVLSVAGLDAWIGAQQILHEVSFEVAPVGVTALLGRNGVGKTTTMRALLGLVRRAGVVRLAGERIDAEPTHRIVRRGIGYVPENREVFGSLSVAENLDLARRGERGRTGDQLLDELFPDLLGRARNRPAPCPAASSRCWPWPGRC